MQRDRGFDAADQIFAQRAVGTLQSGFAVRSVADQLADHRIVVRRNRVAAVGVAIDAHAVAAGRVVKADRAGRRREIARGIFGVDAALDRVLLELDVALVEIELLAVRDADLLLDQIDARHFFGDRMLDLNARVHLDEVDNFPSHRRGTRSCRRSRSRRLRRRGPRPCPSSCADRRVRKGEGDSSISF